MYKKASLSDVLLLQLCMNLIAFARVSTENYCNHILLPYSYSLYEPKSHALMEYNGGLEKAILRDSELLSEVDDAFCKSHPLLAQKVVTRSAHAAVSKIGADALVGGRSTSSNSSSLYAATAARYIAAPLPSAASSSCSTAPAKQSCPHRQQQSCPHLQQQKQEHRRYLHQPHHRHQYWHQCPHHHFACCHPGRCHHHPHGSHGMSQAAEVRDEAGGEEEDKAGEPYSTLKTHILIISILKKFLTSLSSKIKMNL